MKKIITASLLLSTMIFGATIYIEVSNIKNKKGSLVIGLYNTSKTFPIKTEEYKSLIVDANATTLKGH